MIKYDVELKHGQVTQLDIVMNCGNVSVEEIAYKNSLLFLPHKSKRYSLSLFNLNAQLIRKWGLNPGSHNLKLENNLPSGVYILKIQSNDLCRTIKLINH
tara:strand:- start:331 stop:630 length:300 start_codon:yes stop_codon:yes gene_type:complete